MKRLIPLLFLAGCSVNPPQHIYDINAYVNGRMTYVSQPQDKVRAPEFYNWQGDCDDYVVQKACELMKQGNYDWDMSCVTVRQGPDHIVLISGEYVLDNIYTEPVWAGHYPYEQIDCDTTGYEIAAFLCASGLDVHALP